MNWVEVECQHVVMRFTFSSYHHLIPNDIHEGDEVISASTCCVTNGFLITLNPLNRGGSDNGIFFSGCPPSTIPISSRCVQGHQNGPRFYKRFSVYFKHTPSLTSQPRSYTSFLLKSYSQASRSHHHNRDKETLSNRLSVS